MAYLPLIFSGKRTALASPIIGLVIGPSRSASCQFRVLATGTRDLSHLSHQRGSNRNLFFQRKDEKEQEAQENYDRLLRVSAEFENYKKRASREMEEFRKFSNQSLIKEMLSVVDNLELAMKSTNGHKTIDKGLLDGLEMTHKKILKVFEKFNVKPISAKGQPFDPTFHEAVMQEETDEYPGNTVINELQKGYLIHDRLLRPSMVVVAKSKEKKDNTNP